MVETNLPVVKSKDDLCEKAINIYVDKFRQSPAVVACGAGRVNLIGEHTDYQDGYVFPAALDRKTVVALSLNDSGVYRIFSHDLNTEVTWLKTVPGPPTGKADWYFYVLGTVRMFCDVAKVEFPKGFNIICVTSVPIGSGLSSSAALEVATATAMEAATGKTLDPLVKARDVCQAAEHKWAKVPCGLMDQAISVMAMEGHAMLFDCKNQVAVHSPIPEGTSIIVVNSGISHSHVGGEYAKRRASCEAAVELIQKHHANVHSLRDVTPEMLEGVKSHFIDPTYLKRATHVVSENSRALAFAEALRAGDMKKAGRVMYEGHESLKSNYDASVVQTDAIVDIAKQTEGVFGARMTGGGFGGSVCILVESAKADAAMKTILGKYQSFFNQHKSVNGSHDLVVVDPSAFVVKASKGACIYHHVQV